MAGKVNRNPNTKRSCAKRHMNWIAKTAEHVGFCKPKHNKKSARKSPRKSKSKSHSRK